METLLHSRYNRLKMSNKLSSRYIIVTLEIIDGERSFLHELFAELKKGESVERCANRNARNYFSDGRKVRNEEYFETAGGELLIRMIRFVKVDTMDVPVLQKYFMSV